MATDKTQHIQLDYLNRKDFSNRETIGRLRLETGKHYNGGVSSSWRVEHVGLHSVMHAFGLGGGGDLSVTVLRDTTKKATQKNIDTQHAQVFTPEAIAEIQERVRTYYTSGADKL